MMMGTAAMPVFDTQPPLGTRVLVVCDEGRRRQQFCQTLEDRGLQARSVASCVQAMAHIRLERPKVILFSMQPGATGMTVSQFCRGIAAVAHTTDVPVVLAAPPKHGLDEVWARHQGVSNYISLPCTDSDLVWALGSVL